MKDSDLIFGLMASFDKDRYSFSDLACLTEPFDVSVSSLRTNLHRMSAAEVIQVVREGRSAYYSFAAKGQRISRNVSHGFRTPDWSSWDGAYWGLTFSVPESHAETRHSIRKKLGKYRFACLHPGFWLRPAHPDERIPVVLESLMSTGYCRLIRFHNYAEFSLAQAAALWNLRDVNRGFAEGLKLLHTGLEKLPRLSPRLALVEKMTVGDAIVNTLFADPLLPPQFLPDGWQGDVIREQFLSFDRSATRRSKPYWEQIYRKENAV